MVCDLLNEAVLFEYYSPEQQPGAKQLAYMDEQFVVTKPFAFKGL